MHWYSAVKPGEQGFTDKNKVTGQALKHLKDFILYDLELTENEFKGFNKILKKLGYRIGINGDLIEI